LGDLGGELDLERQACPVRGQHQRIAYVGGMGCDGPRGQGVGRCPIELKDCDVTIEDSHPATREHQLWGEIDGLIRQGQRVAENDP